MNINYKALRRPAAALSALALVVGSIVTCDLTLIVCSRPGTNNRKIADERLWSERQLRIYSVSVAVTMSAMMCIVYGRDISNNTAVIIEISVLTPRSLATQPPYPTGFTGLALLPAGTVTRSRWHMDCRWCPGSLGW